MLKDKDEEVSYCAECIYCTDDYIAVNSKKMHHCFMKSCLVGASDEACEEFEEEEYK